MQAVYVIKDTELIKSGEKCNGKHLSEINKSVMENSHISSVI